MNKYFLFLLFVLFPFCLVAQNDSPNPLKGTWKLVNSQWGKMKKLKKPKREIYKIFTDKHFFFIYYSDKKFSGAGGGTYSYTADSFTEKLDYYSWDSTAVGSPQTFDWTITNNQLNQKGKIENTDKYDDYVINEYYERVEEGNWGDAPLAGVWEVTKATYGDETQTAEETASRVLKIFTPKHWYGIFYDKLTGTFKGVGFGTYKLKGDQYYETLNAYSWDQSAVGETYHFTMTIAPTTLIQKGKINSDKYKNYTIREEFKKVDSKPISKEETELAAIQQVIETETQCYYSRDFDCWKDQWHHTDYVSLTWNNPDGTFTSSNGWTQLESNAQLLIKMYPVQDPEKNMPIIKRENWEVRFFGDNGAYLNWTQQNSGREKKQFTTTQEVRVMEKVNGQWKIVNVSSFWDYKNLVDRKEVKD